MIRMTRVDHRLLHGQVAFTWIKHVGADCILIANDSVANDQLRMSVLRMAKPQGTKLVIKSVADSIAALNSGKTDSYQLFIITESIKDAYRLCQEVPAITQVNLGGIAPAADKNQIAKAVFVSEEEIGLLRQLTQAGTTIFAQMTPNDESVDVNKLIA